MKIKNLIIENFKLFDQKFDKIENISGANLILFNGPNGYGKTTVFDAIELALTGEIKRISKYNDDLEISKKEKHAKRLLIADPTKEAFVSMTIETEDCELKLQRVYERPSKGNIKKSAVENNPHKTFEVFRRKVFVNEQEVVSPQDQEDILKRYHLNDIVEFYDKCCFLSQDEHLMFLKEANKDKAKALEFMFKLPEEFEKELNRINGIISSLHNANTKNGLGYLKRLKNRQGELEDALKQLKGNDNGKSDNTIQDNEKKEKLEYNCLFGGKSIKWDEKNPLLNREEYEDAMKSLERLYFYSQHQEDCQNYIFNEPLKKLKKSFVGTVNISYESNSLEYAYRYFPLLQKAEDYENEYNSKKQLEQLKDDLEKQNLNGLKWEAVTQYNLLTKEDIELVKAVIKEIANLEKSQGIVSSMITTIDGARRTLIRYTEEAIQKSIIDDSECPLCGAPYENKVILDKKILEETEKLQALSDETSTMIQEKTEKIYKEYLDAVLVDTKKLLQGSIEEELYQRLQEVKASKMKLEEISSLLNKINISLPQDYSEDIAETAKGYDEFIKAIESNLKHIPNEIEEQLFEKNFFDDYDRYYDKEEKKFLGINSIMFSEKQNYVKEAFYDSKIRMITEKQNELNNVNFLKKVTLNAAMIG